MATLQNSTSMIKDGIRSITAHFGIRSREMTFFFFTVVAAILIAMTLFSFQYALSGSYTILIQSLCGFLALVWAFFTGRGIFRQFFNLTATQVQIHPAWIAILFAIILRLAAYQFMPPPTQTGFEEIEQGSIAYGILHNAFLQVEFRFSNILATLGMASGFGYDLSTLRLPFKVFGIVGLIFSVLVMRKLKINWIPILFLTFVTATLRMFVIFSGTAFELFSGIPMTAIFIFMVVQAEEESTLHRGFWYGIAGCLAGVMMYEFVAYRILPILFFFWILYHAVFKGRTSESETRTQRWYYLLLYLIPLYLVALPTIAQSITNPAGSTFFEAFTRHRGERPALISPNSGFLLMNLLAGSFGFPSAESAYYTIPQDPAILPVVGWMFGLSLLVNLVFPITKYSRPFSISVLLTILLGGLFANDYHVGRMGPNFPVLILLSGFMLQVGYKKITQWIQWLSTRRQIFTVILPENQPLLLERPQTTTEGDDTKDRKTESSDHSQRVIIDMTRLIHHSINVISVFIVIGITAYIVLANFVSIRRMATDFSSLNEYANDDYSVCSFIGNVSQPGQRVVIISIDHGGFCAENPEAGWYFNDKSPVIIHAQDVPSAQSTLQPGDLLVFATRNRSFSQDETGQFTQLAQNLNSLSSIQFGKNFLGKTTVGSFCYQCSQEQ